MRLQEPKCLPRRNKSPWKLIANIQAKNNRLFINGQRQLAISLYWHLYSAKQKNQTGFQWIGCCKGGAPGTVWTENLWVAGESQGAEGRNFYYPSYLTGSLVLQTFATHPESQSQ